MFVFITFKLSMEINESSQYETGTDFLNTYKREGFAPRLLPVYTPGVVYRSTKDQKAAAQRWDDEDYDAKILFALKQLSFRFGINHLKNTETRFMHRIHESATEFHNKMCDDCNAILQDLEFENPDIASAYGKLADRVVQMACVWIAFESTWDLIEEGVTLSKALYEYSEMEFERLDDRLKGGLEVKEGMIEKAFHWCESSMLCDLGLREGYFAKS
eukprot:992919_1